MTSTSGLFDNKRSINVCCFSAFYQKIYKRCVSATFLQLFKTQQPSEIMNRVISSAVKVQKSIFLFVLLFCLSKVFSLKKDGKFSSLVFELSLICSMIVNLASLLKTWLVLNFDSVLSCVVHTVAMAIQMNFQFSVLPMYCIFHF